jgi:hypothetical protein
MLVLAVVMAVMPGIARPGEPTRIASSRSWH